MTEGSAGHRQRRLHRHIPAAGWVTRCCCGWAVVCRSAEAREVDASEYQRGS
jgi:hypothetical protein